MFQCSMQLIDYREPSEASKNQSTAPSGISYRELFGREQQPSTPWSSRAVPQPSTDLALHRFAVEFGWDPAFSMQCGRQLTPMFHHPPSERMLTIGNFELPKQSNFGVEHSKFGVGLRYESLRFLHLCRSKTEVNSFQLLL